MSKNRKIVGHSSGVMLQRIIGMKLGRNALGVSGPSDAFCPISVTLSAFSRLVFYTGPWRADFSVESLHQNTRLSCYSVSQRSDFPADYSV